MVSACEFAREQDVASVDAPTEGTVRVACDAVCILAYEGCTCGGRAEIAKVDLRAADLDRFAIDRDRRGF